jgi:guanylate kinase
VDTFGEAVFSVSSTTRPRRGSERDGVDYSFISQEEFRERLRDGYFLEHAEVHGHLYGTSRCWVMEQLDSGNSVILDIDVQGAVQVKASFPSSVLIFILPPDPGILRERLSSRNTDDPAVVDRRMEVAAWETGWIGSFDYFVRNDDLECARLQVEAVYRAQGIRLDSMPFPTEALNLSPELFSGLDHWRGRSVVVTSGPTREPLDSVRFISNRSSGLMGRSLAQAFRDSGARVIYVSGPVCGPCPAGVQTLEVESASDMLEKLRETVSEADLLVMAAAVADFRPAERVKGKMSRKGSIQLELESTPDILETLHREVPGMCPVLAFALEFGPGGRERAMRKLHSKGAEAIFYNPGDERGAGMESPANRGELIFRDGRSMEVALASKRYIAQLLAAAMGRYMKEKTGTDG